VSQSQFKTTEEQARQRLKVQNAMALGDLSMLDPGERMLTGPLTKGRTKGNLHGTAGPPRWDSREAHACQKPHRCRKCDRHWLSGGVCQPMCKDKTCQGGCYCREYNLLPNGCGDLNQVGGDPGDAFDRAMEAHAAKAVANAAAAEDEARQLNLVLKGATGKGGPRTSTE
jgi:hypothetical protein